MNFYSYSPNQGMQYHKTGALAKQVADEALKTYAGAGTDLKKVTWGEVTERSVDTGSGHVLKNALRLAYEAENPQVIDGRMRNGNDDLVLVRNIHETDLLYHDMVLQIAVIWKSLSGKIERFKGYNFRDVATVLALLDEKYGVKRGGSEGNMQFFTFDKRFKLNIAIQKKLDFGPEFQAAERKMLDALQEMTPAEATDMQTLISAAFKLVDGKLRVTEVLRLRRIKIENALWNEALQIIDAAIIVTSKKKQIRLYERNEVGAYIAIPLDIAAL